LRHSVENVAIANASQLEAARATPALSLFNYDAMPTAVPSFKSLNLSAAVLYRFFLLIHYDTMCPGPLTL